MVKLIAGGYYTLIRIMAIVSQVINVDPCGLLFELQHVSSYQFFALSFD